MHETKVFKNYIILIAPEAIISYLTMIFSSCEAEISLDIKIVMLKAICTS